MTTTTTTKTLAELHNDAILLHGVCEAMNLVANEVSTGISREAGAMIACMEEVQRMARRLADDIEAAETAGTAGRNRPAGTGR